MDRSERIGRWVSGVGHVGILGWAAIGGALFGPQPSPPIQMTQVATMTEAEFQDFAAASRGAGPVQGATRIVGQRSWRRGQPLRAHGLQRQRIG